VAVQAVIPEELLDRVELAAAVMEQLMAEQVLLVLTTQAAAVAAPVERLAHQVHLVVPVAPVLSSLKFLLISRLLSLVV